MSGHSKWSTIKHRKAASDARRGKMFSRLAREIIVAARHGGGDPDANITLRAVIQKARAVNMPADNIERAIRRATGEADGAALEEIVYEAFAPGGVGLLIEVVTDNRNRTAAELRRVLTRHGAGIAGQGAVQRFFQRKGHIRVARSAVPEERLLELAAEAGGEDLRTESGQFVIVTPPAGYEPVLRALERAGVEVAESGMTMDPDMTLPVVDQAQAEALLRLLEELEDLDDVQNVFANCDIDDGLLERIGS